MVLDRLLITKQNESSCQLLLRILRSHGWRGHAYIDISFPFLMIDWTSNTFWQASFLTMESNEIFIEQALEKAYSL